MTSTDHPPVIHFVDSLLLHLSAHSVLGRTRVMKYGDEIELTDEVIEANRDRHGRSWIDDWLNTGDEEYHRGGKVVARRGPWPAGTCRLSPGSFEWYEARGQAVKQTFLIEDQAARAEARREVESFYGSLPSSGQTMRVIAPAPVQ